MKAVVLSSHIHTLSCLEYSSSLNQVDNDMLCIGFITKQTINKLYKEGYISTRDFLKFYSRVMKFLVGAVDYLFKCCQLEEEILIHATWLIFEKWLQTNFLAAEYFVHTFPM